MLCREGEFSAFKYEFIDFDLSKLMNIWICFFLFIIFVPITILICVCVVFNNSYHVVEKQVLNYFYYMKNIFCYKLKNVMGWFMPMIFFSWKITVKPIFSSWPFKLIYCWVTFWLIYAYLIYYSKIHGQY